MYSRTGTRSSYFLVDVQSPEDLGRVEKMLIVEYSVAIINPFATSIFSRISHFLALKATKGRLRRSAIQYPLIRKSTVKNACNAASGTIYVLSLLQSSIGLI